MDRTENLERDRLQRLRALAAVLGQPDLLTILKVTTVSSFLTTRKSYEKEEKFVFGLNFPTTAHFSSYMNKVIKDDNKNNKSEIMYKIRLHTFDVFHKIDFQIEINIPGSLEIKAFGLNGQPTSITAADYERAYFSSVLRSLYPHKYHPLCLVYGQVENFEVLSSFCRSFVPFCMNNDIPCAQQLLDIENLGLELLINYVKSYQFWNLSAVIQAQLAKYFPSRAFLLDLEIKELKEQYKEIIVDCAKNLIKDNLGAEEKRILTEFQLRALAKLKRRSEAKVIGEIVVQQGLEKLETWEQILKVYFEQGNDREYFKMLNTAVSLTSEEATYKQKIQSLVYPKRMPTIKTAQEKVGPTNQMSSFPEYFFDFDYSFLQMDSKLKELQDLLEKSQKQKPTSEMLQRLDISFSKESFFQKFIALFEKHRTWNRLLHKRAQCFWLQNDYVAYETSIKKKSSDVSYRFINQSFTEQSQSGKKSIESNKSIDEKVMELEGEGSQNEKPSSHMNESFEGQFSDSETEHEKQIVMGAPCSKRVVTKRVTRELASKKLEFSKVLCNYALQKLFLVGYNNLKLQSDIDTWTSKLNLETLPQMSKQKKELIALVFLKKGFFQKAILRFRKSEEAFKLARKCSQSASVGLIACYNLAKLYLEHKYPKPQLSNIKGVEYYTVEMVRILYSLGVEQYDAVPVWAKEIIPFIIRQHGKAIVKRLQGPLKQIVQLWLKIDNQSV